MLTNSSSGGSEYFTLGQALGCALMYALVHSVLRTVLNLWYSSSFEFVT